MARSNSAWFEFAGINSRDMGVQLKDAHIDFSGKWRGEIKEIPHKNGFLWMGENAREYYEIKRTCRVRESNKRAVKAWLMGQGFLRFSHEPEAQYDARIIQRVEFKMVCPGADPIYEFTVVFTCQPDPYVYPAAGDFTAVTSGTLIPAPEPMSPLTEEPKTQKLQAWPFAVGGVIVVIVGVVAVVVFKQRKKANPAVRGKAELETNDNRGVDA